MEEKKPDRRFVVCVREDLKGLTYGKTYEVLHENDDFGFIEIIDDNGNIILPPWFVLEQQIPVIVNFKESRRYYGIPKKRFDNFITLENWRELQLNKLLE